MTGLHLYSGIAHIVNRIEDLYANDMVGKGGVRVLVNSRLNGRPHIGTLVNYMTGFVLADRLRTAYGVPAQLIVELLDNISDSALGVNTVIGGQEFYCFDGVAGSEEMARNYASFSSLVGLLCADFSIEAEIKTYEDIVRSQTFRKSLVEVVRNQAYFSRQLQPGDARLHVRAPCPECGLMRKAPCTSELMPESADSFRVRDTCPIHGEHEVLFSVDNDVLLGVNNTVRIFCRGLSLVDEDAQRNSFSVIINGYDWAGVWPLQVHFSGMLQLGRKALPAILYCPLVTDDSGNKVSKTRIAGAATRAWHEDASMLDTGELRAVRREVERWFDNPEAFFAHYPIRHFGRLLGRREDGLEI